MKRFIAFLLVVSSLLLVSCNGGEPTENGFIDPDTGIEYVDVTPMGLYPVDPGEEFITVSVDGEETVYHEVWFEEPSRFLCYEVEGYYFLMRASDVKEPDLREFNPIAASIYSKNNTVKFDNLFADPEYLPEENRDEETYGETALVKQIQDAIMDGESVEVNIKAEDIGTHFYLHMLSADYPGLYYIISFFSYNGRYFLRDDAMNKTVYCPRDVVIRMVGEE
ncbi:MAG: hypothetical protein IIW39_05470 [Clostridia bacterium]|nr:hypothetical protein [Clostridia bacterium]MBQ5838105.1 hypothetical protein [Clostridia bacterium]